MALAYQPFTRLLAGRLLGNFRGDHLATKKSTTKSKSKVKKTMEEFKEGSLKSGSGKKVTSRKQAIAIGLSEARKSGAKVPKKKSS
jgi:hypothetical protein